MSGNVKLTSTRQHFYLLLAEMLQFLSQIKHRFFNIIKRVTRTDSDDGWVCRSRRNRERLETLHRHKDTIETPAKDTETFDINTISVQHALPFLKTNVLFIRSLLPGGNGCDGLCVKAAPAQHFSSSDLQSPAPVASVVLQLDSLQPFPDLWSAVSPQSGFSQCSV